MDEMPPLPEPWIELQGSEGLFLAERSGPDGRPIRQTSTTRRGLIQACRGYDDFAERHGEPNSGVTIIDGIQST